MAPRAGAALFTLIGLGFSAAGAQDGTLPYRTTPHLFLEIAVLATTAGSSVTLARATIEASDGKPGRASVPLDLVTSAGRLARLDLEIRASPLTGARFPLGVTSIAVVEAPGGLSREYRRERSETISEGSSFLHQAFESGPGGVALYVTLTSEVREIPEFVRPSAGRPVLFRVAVSRTEGDRTLPLENNILRTFEGSAVSYSFKRPAPGSPPEESFYEEVELSLLPRRGADGTLLVEASLLSRTSASPSSDRAPSSLLLRRTETLPPGASFHMLLPDAGATDGYRFEISAEVE